MNQQYERFKICLIMGLLTLVSVTGFLLISAGYYRLGFPLDDAWIHQTYARNLAETGKWAFFPGQPSAGSTAPLWTVMLVVGHWISSPKVWTYFLGWALLWSLAVVALYGFQSLAPGKRRWAAWVGAFIGLEWHLVWSAVSGMETLLFSLLVLGVLTWLVHVDRRRLILPVGRTKEPPREAWTWLGLGCLAGLSGWVRPDGVTLLGPILLVAVFTTRNNPRLFRIAGSVLIGFLVFFGPYLVFNRVIAGAWWPNTFYAKPAEYSIYQQIPLWKRLLEQFQLPLVGAGILVLPGFIFKMASALWERRWSTLAAGLWVGGFLALYAWRLPVTYQHGRYVVPVMPVYFLLGLAGLAQLVDLNAQRPWQRITSRFWVISTAVVLLIFWGLGARAYALDVGIIESEWVETARWVSEHTEPDALIATHDIGALGYFGQRNLLDLAGLISPDVIPFIRDEVALRKYLDDSQADYLVTLPSWYPELSKYGSLVFQGRGFVAEQMDAEHLAVYRWANPQK